MTTHLMEEAERLCDRVAIIEHGRVIEIGSPAALVARHCPERAIVFSTDAADMPARLAGLRDAHVERTATTYTLRGRGDGFVTDVINWIAREQLQVTNFRTEAPTLEDVFLRLTGHTVRA